MLTGKTRRIVDWPQVSAPAQHLAFGEGAPHPVFHPAATCRPLLTDALMSEDDLGHLAVTGACRTTIDRDEGVADELLVAGALGPARSHVQQVGIRRQDR